MTIPSWRVRQSPEKGEGLYYTLFWLTTVLLRASPNFRPDFCVFFSEVRVWNSTRSPSTVASEIGFRLEHFKFALSDNQLYCVC
jgi:hypothetical protein